MTDNGMEGIKDNPKLLGLSTGRTDLPLTEMGNSVEVRCSGGNPGDSVRCIRLETPCDYPREVLTGQRSYKSGKRSRWEI